MPRADLDETVAALREIVLACQYHAADAAKQVGLSLSDNLAVSYLTARGPMSQTELAKAIGLASASVTVLVDRLEARGLVRRENDPTDRRRIFVTLIESDTPLVEELGGGLLNICARLSAADRRHVVRLLPELARGLRCDGESQRPIHAELRALASTSAQDRDDELAVRARRPRLAAVPQTTNGVTPKVGVGRPFVNPVATPRTRSPQR